MKYEEEGTKPGPKRKLSLYEEFILTPVRLRLEIGYHKSSLPVYITYARCFQSTYQMAV